MSKIKMNQLSQNYLVNQMDRLNKKIDKNQWNEKNKMNQLSQNYLANQMNHLNKKIDKNGWNK